MSQEQLFASFVLDRDQGLEIALKADYVTEATPVQGTIQKLPGSVDFLEGIMHLREDVIPVINLKKRLGLETADYAPEAKVAVVSLFNSRYGLLFEDIKEVFRAEPDLIVPISEALRTEDQAISALIKLEPGRRAVELLDLNHLLDVKTANLEGLSRSDSAQSSTPVRKTSYSRYVIFGCNAQEYGIPVEMCREITFCTTINEMFRTGMTAGAIELRGKTIPVMNTSGLLTGDPGLALKLGDSTRVLVLSSDDCTVGLIIDEIKEIITIADDAILPFPPGNTSNVTGMYPRSNQQNTILLNIHSLVCDHLEGIKSMANIGNGDREKTEDTAETAVQSTSHHLITENCYLIFTIGRNFAIEIKDVKEIIENTTMMKTPGATGFNCGVINLRGEVVPVVNLRSFYHLESSSSELQSKLIICSAHGQTVALEVDQIVTIYKQEQYHATPSLSKNLNDRKDTVDRLIEYLNEDDLKEHVLVLNVHNLIRNHLQLGGQTAGPLESETEIDPEDNHDSLT